MAPYDNLKKLLCIKFFMVLTIFAPLLGFGQALIHSQHSAFIRAPQSEPQDDVTLILKLKKGVHQEATGLDGQRIDLTNGAAIEIKIPRMYKDNIESGRDSVSVNLLRAFAGDSKQNIKILDYGRGRRERVDPKNLPEATINIMSLALNQEVHYVGRESDDPTPAEIAFGKRSLGAKNKNRKKQNNSSPVSPPPESTVGVTAGGYRCIECAARSASPPPRNSNSQNNRRDLEDLASRLADEGLQVPQTVDEVRSKYAYYSNHPLVQDMVRKVENLKPYPSKAQQIKEGLYCYRSVKFLLSAHGDDSRYGLATHYLEGNLPSIHAGPALEADGFINIYDLKNPGIFAHPDNAPKGSILVYEGGGPGHIEIKAGEAGERGVFGATYRSNHSRTGLGTEVSRGNRNRHRKLIGIYVLPEEILNSRKTTKYPVKMARK